MRVSPASHRVSTWYRIGVLAVALVVGLQGAPVQKLAEYMSPEPCVCEEQGFCPRNPDGACACDHHGHDDRAPSSRTEAESGNAFDGPVLQSCETTSADVVTFLSPIKWVVESSRVALPPSSSAPATPALRTVSSQRVGADIFRPPRYRAA